MSEPRRMMPWRRTTTRTAVARRPRGPLRLVPVWAALAGTFTLAVTVLGVVLWTGLDLLGVKTFKPEKALTSTTLFDLVKLAFAVVAGIGGVVALVIAYRRQRLAEQAHQLAEAGEDRAKAAALREATKLHTDRFTAAAGQLGDDSSAIQLAGVHALAGLADDAPTTALRQTCIDVLCAYLRMPYEGDPGDPAPDATTDQTREHAAARHTYRALREVRHTVIRVITAHLRNDTEASWQGHDLDFTDVVFDGGNFTGAVFATDPNRNLHGRVDFRGAQFASGLVNFSGVKFTGGTVDFTNVKFTGGTVGFMNAEFTGGTVGFRNAEFTGGTVGFRNAEFTGGTVGFMNAEFTSGLVDFTNVKFTGGTVDFTLAEFTSGTVDFRNAEFTSGTVDFTLAKFTGGTVDFMNAQFTGGTVDLKDAKFTSGTVDFRYAEFTSGTVDFRNAKFTGGTVDFRYAKFTNGTVDFSYAKFTNGTVDFRNAVGDRPPGLVAGPVVQLPAAWPAPPEGGVAEAAS